MWCKVACDYSVFHLFFVMLCALQYSEKKLYRSHSHYTVAICEWIVHAQDVLYSLLLTQHSAKCNSAHQIDEKPAPRMATCYSICIEAYINNNFLIYWQKKLPLLHWLQRFSAAFNKLAQFFVTHLQRQKLKCSIWKFALLTLAHHVELKFSNDNGQR